MRRREFIRLLAGTATTLPFTVRAQQVTLPVVGVLSNATASDKQDLMAAFHRGLRQAGFVEGQNVKIEYRYANNWIDVLPNLAADLVRDHVAVIFASSSSSGIAAKAATHTVPIVFVLGIDPLQAGLVRSLNHPGENLTGSSFLDLETVAKRLQVLHEVVPKASLIALLANPTVAQTEQDIKLGQDAARELGLEFRVANASNEAEIDDAFAAIDGWRAGGLVVSGNSFFGVEAKRLANLAARYRLPAIYERRQFPAAGGLMSYGASHEEAYRVAGNYVGRILKGEQPSDLPVQKTTKVEMVINLKAAKVLNLSIPLPLLARADEVIE